MPCGKEACYPVERLAKVIAIPQFGAARVEGHSQPQAANCPPLCCRNCMKGALGGESCLHAVRSGRKGRGKAAAHRLEDIATVTLDGLAQKLIMQADGSLHGVRMVFP